MESTCGLDVDAAFLPPEIPTSPPKLVLDGVAVLAAEPVIMMFIDVWIEGVLLMALLMALLEESVDSVVVVVDVVAVTVELGVEDGEEDGDCDDVDVVDSGAALVFVAASLAVLDGAELLVGIVGGPAIVAGAIFGQSAATPLP